MTEVDLNPDTAHSPQHSVELARISDKAIITLNEATQADRGGLSHPADVASIVDELATLSSQFPQLLRQMSEFLANAVANRRLVDDRDGSNGATAVAYAAGQMQDAADHACRMYLRLQEAHEAINRLSYDSSEDDD